MREKLNGQSDRIIRRTMTTNAEGEPVIANEKVIMKELPKSPATYKTDAVLPKGLTLLDLMPMQERIENDPYLTIKGDAVGENEKPMHVPIIDGTGVIELTQNEQIIIYAANLTQKLQDQRREKKERAKKYPSVHYWLHR